MVSLRGRLLVAVLALSAVGMLLLGGITYVEQRSFLMERLDEQTRAAPGAVVRALEFQEYGEVRGGDGPPPGGDGGPLGLPAGVYGERRRADGSVSRVTLAVDEQQARPALPDALPLNRLVTVGSRGKDGTRYRVLAEPDRRGDGVIVAAVPLREVEQTLQRLLLVLALVLRACCCSSARRPGRSCASASCRWTGSATRRGRSPAATSPGASPRPIRGPR